MAARRLELSALLLELAVELRVPDGQNGLAREGLKQVHDLRAIGSGLVSPDHEHADDPLLDCLIVLTAIFPRNDNVAVMPTIAHINANLAKLADGKSVRFLDVNARLADAKGVLFEGTMVDSLHPSLKGYEIWAEGLRPILTELLGPPSATDHAPPPTGDPSAAERAAR